MLARSMVTTRSVQVRQQLSQVVQVIIGSLLIGLLAQIRIPLLFTPVPITLQTFAILLIAGTLGSKKGTLAVLAYLTEVSCGLPVLAGTVSHPLALAGMNGGYLVGFIPLAFFTGWIFERKIHWTNGLTCAVLIMGCFLQLFIGSLWLGLFVGKSQALLMGFIPFIPGEMLKVLCATVAVRKFRLRFA